jgi:tRNA pseudouridine synthase 10
MIPLCGECASRFEKEFPIGECAICGGKLAGLGALAKEGASLIGEDWDSFSVSTSISKKVLATEERAFDFCAGESIKTFMNRELSNKVAELSGKEYDASGGDGRLLFDFRSWTVRKEAEPLFFFGRYRKLKEGLSQTIWHCRECRGRGCKRCEGKGVMYRSVEEIIALPFEKRVGGKGTMHASGREDVDVLNLGGRPFVLQVSNPERRKADLEEVAEEINAGGEVEALDLKKVKRGDVELVADSHFPKTYRAWVEVEGGASEVDLGKLGGFDEVLEQRTPERVAHRRSDLVRKRRAEVVRAEIQDGLIVADVRADAGTYIKELVHGDGGRTVPSFSSLLGKKCGCAKLWVMKIEDEFLRLVLG